MRKTHAPRTWYTTEHKEYRAKIDRLRKIKSKLDKKAILDSEDSAKKLHEVIYNPSSSTYGDYEYSKPVSATIGFYGIG